MNSGDKPYQNDNELLELYLAGGGNEYLGTLLQRYSIMLFGVCMKYLKNQQEAKDAVQQVFLKVITDVSKFKIEHFKSWLYMVAKNHCLMTLRKKGLRLTEIDERSMGETEEENVKELLRDKENRLQKLETALGTLNPPQKKCIMLFYLEKKSYREISTVTGFSELQVKSHIQNGKRNLKIFLETEKDHE